MYVLPQYDELRPEVLHALVRGRPFATLITSVDGDVLANHVPVLVRSNSGPGGVIVGHVAKANPVWTTSPSGSRPLIVFHGENHYISPRWYVSRGEQGKALPTWDYAVVHVRGPIEWIHDAAWVQGLIEEMIHTFEPDNDNPWRMSEMSDDSRKSLLERIVGFRIPVDEIRGKYKLNQRSAPEDRQSIVSALNTMGTGAALAMAQAIRDAGESP